MHKNVLDFEPEGALFVPDENPLIFYKALAEWGLYLLKPGGRMFMEINEALGDETKKILLQYGYSEISVNRDINEKDRMVACLRP
jgi:release factor glutamine methyltransferase